ncbi:MAG TPA: OmpA family protein [Candidatus Nanopelagicales bacterium]|nr:OmpA family protein [Candidatus Nanopelagicales bacterium]
MKPTTTRWLRGGAAFLALAAASSPAAAQNAAPTAGEQGIALNRFTPAPAGDRMFGVASPYASSPDMDGSPALHFMILGDYANNPLVLRRESTGESEGAIVSGQFFLHLSAALVLWERLHLHVNVPFALYQGGDSPAAEGLDFASPTGAELGDMRLGLRLRLIGEYFDPFQLAVGGYVWLPTANGDAGSFVGEGSVRGMPQIIVGGRFDSMVWSTNLGIDLRPGQVYQGVQQGLMFHGGAGVGFLLGSEKQVQVGPEVTVSTVLEGEGPQQRNTNAELLFGGRYRFLSSLEAGVGIGPGLTSGIGTPDFRAVGMIAFSPEVKKPIDDRDKDGIKDAQDACPDVYGVADADPKKHGCPPAPPDRDKDGILDAQDACPDEPGVDNPDPKKHGCPPPGDKDGDKILDDVDACVDVAGVPSADPKQHGCPPPDTDKDGVIDAKDACVDIPGEATDDPATNGCPDTDKDGIYVPADACPNEKGKPSPDPQQNGCPTSVRVTEKEIIILQQVQFDTGRATIKRVSDPLLDEVAAVLKEHPEITRVEVQGHTDIRGNRAYNLTLSQNRANAVMKALTQRGIEESRLTAKGYGPDVPIGDNKTEEGRQKNRRVQFKIIEKKPKEAVVPQPASGAVVPQPASGAAVAAPPAAPPASGAPAAPKPQPSPQAPQLLPQK